MLAAKSKKKASGKSAKATSKPAKGGGFGGGTSSKKQMTCNIPSIELGTGLSLPALSFGTYRTGGEELRQALDHAIAVGYRSFDTARAYQNEAIVGEAIAASGVSREEFIVTTKLWETDHGSARAKQAIEESLHALGTSYIDVCLVHGPDNRGSTAEEKVALRQETWLAMEEARDAGVLRAIGTSNFEPRHLQSVLACGSVVPALNQVEMHAHLAQAEIRAFCAEHGIRVQAYGSVGAKGLRAHPVVQAIAAAHKRSPAQVSLRHTLQARGALVLAKSLTPRRITENAQLFDFELSAEEVAALDALDEGKRSYWDNSAVP